MELIDYLKKSLKNHSENISSRNEIRITYQDAFKVIQLYELIKVIEKGMGHEDQFSVTKGTLKDKIKQLEGEK